MDAERLRQLAALGDSGAQVALRRFELRRGAHHDLATVLPHVVVLVVRTCYACPAQWDGVVFGGAWPIFYLRYRWGRLALRFGASVDESFDRDPACVVDTDDEWDGYMELDEAAALLRGHIRGLVECQIAQLEAAAEAGHRASSQEGDAR